MQTAMPFHWKMAISSFEITTLFFTAKKDTQKLMTNHKSACSSASGWICQMCAHLPMKAECATVLSATAKWVGQPLTSSQATISPPIAVTKMAYPKYSNYHWFCTSQTAGVQQAHKSGF